MLLFFFVCVLRGLKIREAQSRNNGSGYKSYPLSCGQQALQVDLRVEPLGVCAKRLLLVGISQTHEREKIM